MAGTIRHRILWTPVPLAVSMESGLDGRNNLVIWAIGLSLIFGSQWSPA